MGKLQSPMLLKPNFVNPEPDTNPKPKARARPKPKIFYRVPGLVFWSDSDFWIESQEFKSSPKQNKISPGLTKLWGGRVSGVRRPEKQLTAARCTRRKTGCSRPRCTEINESGDILYLIYFHQATLGKIIILFVTCGILCKKIWSVSLITHSFSVFSFLMHAWQGVVRDR